MKIPPEGINVCKKFDPDQPIVDLETGLNSKGQFEETVQFVDPNPEPMTSVMFKKLSEAHPGDRIDIVIPVSERQQVTLRAVIESCDWEDLEVRK